MTNIDQFESLFNKADKQSFSLQPVDLDSILVVSDVGSVETEAFMHRVIDFLDTTLLTKAIQWHTVNGDEHRSVSDLLNQVEAVQPDLICTFRNLHAPATDYPYSLGVYLDVLSQTTSMPVLVLPSPHRDSSIPTSTSTVMAIADKLTGDNKLVSYAARLTTPEGRLLLTHVEDQSVFNRYINVISKIPSIDTDSARAAIKEQLLAEPRDYSRTCMRGIAAAELPISVEEIITFGHSLKDYQLLLSQHDVDLLVLNTKNEDQLAMNGLAYPLCVEQRDTPILML